MQTILTTKHSSISDVVIIELMSFRDHRGEFVTTFRQDQHQFKDLFGQPIQFLEDNFSVSTKNVLRGMHGDWLTWKLIHLIAGQVFFVIADMRENSPSYLQMATFNLSESPRIQILIPPGCINGHLCLSERSIFSYKQSQIYVNSAGQINVPWNDPSLKIPWPVSSPIMSDRDRSAANIKR